MRIAIGVEYKGTSYHGWQKQKDDDATVQHVVEKALSCVAAHKVDVVCAGRTDTGVHARGQVVHFDTSAKRDLKNWISGGNCNLPPDVSFRWAREVDDGFHARFSAIARRYRYIIFNHKIRSALFAEQTTWHYHSLDHELMHQAAQHLVGKHDFSSFRGCTCQAHSPIRDVHFVNVRCANNLIIIDIKANAFLLHMVRNVAGVLLAIGEGKKSPEWAAEVLKVCDRTVAGITAPPHGLYFQEVYYP